jgi:helicase required for RNAi-mediated heterochromatin assembly 1
MKAFKEVQKIEDIHPQIIGNISIYDKVQIKKPIFNRGGCFLSISVRPKENRSGRLPKIKWDKTRRLMYGSLLILFNRDFKKIFIASVHEKPPTKELRENYQKNGFVDVTIQLILENNKRLKYNDYIELSELSNEMIIFEAKNHLGAQLEFLKTIKSIKDWNLPFEDVIIHNQTILIDRPAYLTPDSVYELNLNDVIPEEANKKYVYIMGKLPDEYKGTMDDHQYRALHHILTKKVAVIQGPPGN